MESNNVCHLHSGEEFFTESTELLNIDLRHGAAFGGSISSTDNTSIEIKSTKGKPKRFNTP